MRRADFSAEFEGEPVFGGGAAHGFLDAIFEAGEGEGKLAALEGNAEHDDVGVELGAEAAFGKQGDIGAEVAGGVGVFAQGFLERIDAEVVGAEERVDGGRFLAVDDGVGFGAGDAEVALGIDAARSFEDVDAEHEVGFAVGDDGRDVVAAGLEKGDVRVDAAVADGEAVFVAEDDAIAFTMTGADEGGGGNADAHAADAGEVGVPDVGEVAADGQRDFLLLELGQEGERFLRAEDDDFLEGGAGVELGAGGVVDAPGEVGLHFGAEIGFGESEAGAAGGAGADEAVFADVGVDVDVVPGVEKSFFADFGALIAGAAAVEGNAAFLVGDDDLDAVFEHGRFEQAAVIGAAGGIGAHDLDRFVLDHGADDLFDLLRPGFVAEHVAIEAGGGLLAGHRGGFVVEDDVGDVLAVLDRVGNGELAAVEKGGVAHEDDLFVGDERVDAEAGAAAESHAAVVVHEVLVGLEHEHGVAAGVAVEDEVDRLAAMDVAHVVGVEELALDFAEDAGGVAMRAAGAEGGGAGGQVDFDFAVGGKES